jgi:hypothetical protein
MNAWRRTVLRHPSVYRLVFMRLVPDLELGPAFGQVAYGALGQLQALVERVAPGPGVHERTLAWHALTEGLASMEVRGQMLDTLNAERIWLDALTALIRGFESADVGGARGIPNRRGR